MGPRVPRELGCQTLLSETFATVELIFSLKFISLFLFSSLSIGLVSLVVACFSRFIRAFRIPHNSRYTQPHTNTFFHNLSLSGLFLVLLHNVQDAPRFSCPHPACGG